MTGYSRDAGSTSSTSTGISPHLRSHRSPDPSFDAPRKRTWGGPSTERNTTTNTPGQSLEISLSQLSLERSPPTSSLEVACEQLRNCIQRLRPAPLDVKHADVAYKTYITIRDKSRALCEAVLQSPPAPQPPSSSSPDARAKSNKTLSLASSLSCLTLDSSTASSSGSVVTSYQSPNVHIQSLDLLRNWIYCLENLLGLLRQPLLESYQACEPSASPAMVEQLFQDKIFRRNAIARMKTTYSTTMSSVKSEFFIQYNARFRDHDKLKADVVDMQRLLQAGESGISPGRVIEDIIISERGDAILEFANRGSEDFPVYHFRVSSHMLGETSPIFAQMFNESTLLPAPDGDADQGLPPSPSLYTCEDGSKVRLFRMPQLELNIGGSLGILLHAAHMHNDRIPREIDFDVFVSIAEACMRYQCTAPLELTVEHLWLPQWMHKATEDMPDGLLMISYAFGLRRLFTRMSKTAILNITDQGELESKAWPKPIRDKIWAVRTAKMGQVHHCCSTTLQEYLRCPPATLPPANTLSTPGLVPTVKPRCSKGSHSCDAVSLGWLMMLFNEQQVLPQILCSTALIRRPPLPKRSLNQLVDNLRFMESPPQTHTGPCDFASTFRAAINDIYNSVTGLTLFDVAGKHGWALSRHKSLLPQPVLKLGARLPDQEAEGRAIQDVSLKILRHLDSLDDVYSAALVNKAFFQAFKDNELLILRCLIGKSSSPERWTLSGATNKTEARAEMKSLKQSTLTPKSHDASFSMARIQEEAISIEDSCEGVNAPVIQSVFEEDSDVENYRESSSSESLIEVITNPRDTFGERMTREEAERILWPDDAPSPTSPIPVSEPPPLSITRETTEKFRSGDLIFGSLDQKTLIVREEKNLSNEHYERIGLTRPSPTERTRGVSDWI